MKVLLTGGSGFVAAHCLEVLVARGYEVVTTVRTRQKESFITSQYPNAKVSFAIVPDISQKGAFDETIKTHSPLDAVIHTASPFHYNVLDNKSDMLDPAIIGTTSILQALKSYGGSSVKRVVITSSFAAMTNPADPPTVYNESAWNPMTWEEALTTTNPQVCYRGSKKFAEEAAWKFMEREQPLTFQLTVLNPPLVFGPVLHDLGEKGLDALNTSNKRILNILQGVHHKGPIGSNFYVDVRNLAEAHVRAVESSYADVAGKRVFVTAGGFSDLKCAEVIREKFPTHRGSVGEDLVQHLKQGEKSSGPEADNSRSTELLRLQYNTIEQTVIDTVQSLLDHGA